MEITITDIARVCHEANRAYCLALGDTSQLPWEAAPDWQRQSAIKGVVAHLADDLSPEQSHTLWLDHKKAEGWSYGPDKDEATKTHPCCVPYEDLPQEQRVKDSLFSAIVSVFKQAGAGNPQERGIVFVYKKADGSYCEAKVKASCRHLYPTLSKEELDEAYSSPSAVWSDDLDLDEDQG